jgi:16S rRNA (adenine(1408)-N(1))-methyltransferase
MHTIRGRTADTISREELLALVARYAGVTLDLGAGDGAWAYRHATAHPGRFVIAMDPVRENMREWSAKAAKKPEKGGAPNALFIVASIESPPDELRRIANEIVVTLPWGSLMRGLILGEDTVLTGIASFAQHGASLRIVLNTRIFDDPVPIEVRDLPEVTPEYVVSTLTPLYEAHGIRIDGSRWMDADEVAVLGTTWAKRLSHRHPPRSVLIEATIRSTKGHEDLEG